MKKCQGRTQVMSRVTGFFSVVQNWNRGKREEYKDRLNYNPQKALEAKIEKEEEAKP